MLELTVLNSFSIDHFCKHHQLLSYKTVLFLEEPLVLEQVCKSDARFYGAGLRAGPQALLAFS